MSDRSLSPVKVTDMPATSRVIVSSDIGGDHKFDHERDGARLEQHKSRGVIALIRRAGGAGLRFEGAEICDEEEELV